MTGRRILLGATLTAAVAVMAALWGMQAEANRHLREQSETAQQLLSRLAVLEVDNQRLSNIVAQANTPLAEEQLAELSKLREDVRRLRSRTNDVQTLRTELQRLRAQLSNVRSMASNAPDVPAGDIYPRDSWTFAGFDTPENTIESATWAISEGDELSYLDSLTPELREEMQEQLADGSFADLGPLEMGGASGFRILDRQTVSDNERTIVIYMDGDGSTVPVTVIKTPDGWKVAAEGN